MTLRHFKIFVAVCDTMNMTSAAEALFISQSAVSQAIAELENHYDIKLFERLSRKLYLTQAGEKLLSYARHMICMNLEVENDMKSLHENGAVRIGASVTVGAYVLPKLVSTYKKENPQAKLEVFEDNTEKIQDLILQDKVDIALVEGETTSSDIFSQPLMADELTLICGKSHPFARLTAVDAKALEKEDFIVREIGSGTRKTFEDAMKEYGLSWQAAWTCNNADTIKIAVSEGLGVSVISKRAIQNEIKMGLLCQLAVNGIAFERQFKLIYHKNKYLTAAIQKFIQVCLTHHENLI